VETSIFTFALDFQDEGVDRVLDNIQHRAGLAGVTVALAYHAAKDVFPHNPRRRVYFQPGGVVYFHPDAARYKGLKLQPRVDATAAGADTLPKIVGSARSRGLRVHAWVNYCHQDSSDPELSTLTYNAFGDPDVAHLCPANPDVRAYLRALTGDITARGVETLLVENVHFNPVEHGQHHERFFIDLAPLTRFLLGLCFCKHCRAKAAASGVDGDALADFVRGRVQDVFDHGEDQAPQGELRREDVEGLAGGEMSGYLKCRESSSLELMGDVAEAARSNGVRTHFMDPSGAVKGYMTGKPTGDAAPTIAWRLGVPVREMAAAAGGLAVMAYAADPERVRFDLTAYRDTAGPAIELIAAMRPVPPDCFTPDDIKIKVHVLKDLGVARVDMYHYSFLRLKVLDSLGEALAGVATA
jgi:hypothetical protein